MATLSNKTFASERALGEAIIKSAPQLQGRDPEEIGKKAREMPAFKDVQIVPVNYSDIDPWEMAKRLPSSAGQVLEDTVDGFAQIIEHPWDSAVSLGKVGAGLADIGANAIGVDLDIASDESEATAGQVVDAVKKSFSPGGLQNHPFEAIANAASIIPGGAILGGASRVAKGAKLSKGLRTASTIARNLDPSDALINATVGATKRVAAAPRGLLNRLSNKASSKVDMLGEDIFGPSSYTGFQHAYASVLGLPINTPPPALKMLGRDGSSMVKLPQALAEKTGMSEIPFYRAMEIAQKLEDEAFAPHLAEQAFKAADVLHHNARQAHAAGMGSLSNVMRQAVPRDPGNDIFVKIMEAVEAQDLGIRVVPGAKKPFKVAFERDIFADSGARNALKRQLEDIANMGWRKKPESKLLNDKGKQISTGQDWEPIDVPWNRVHDFREKIDDIISKMDPAGTSDRQRAALVNLRKSIADILTTSLDEVTPEGALSYSSLMRNYNVLTHRKAIMGQWIGANPGQIDRLGQMSEKRINTIFNGMVGALTDDPTRAKALPVVQEMQRLLGDETILPTIIAAHTKNPLGGGLVGRAAASEMARGLAAPATLGTAFGIGSWLGGLLGGAALAIPAMVLISPRLMSRVIGRNKLWVDALKRQGLSVADVVKQTQKRMSRITNNKVATQIRLAVKEGLSLGQLYQRLEDEGLADLQDDGKGRSLITTLGQAKRN